MLNLETSFCYPLRSGRGNGEMLEELLKSLVEVKLGSSAQSFSFHTHFALAQI